MINYFQYPDYSRIKGYITNYKGMPDYIFWIYWVMNYMSDLEIFQIINISKRFLLMDYKEGYKPLCYKKNDEFPTRKFNPVNFQKYFVWIWDHYVLYSNYVNLNQFKNISYN